MENRLKSFTDAEIIASDINVLSYDLTDVYQNDFDSYCNIIIEECELDSIAMTDEEIDELQSRALVENFMDIYDSCEGKDYIMD